MLIQIQYIWKVITHLLLWCKPKNANVLLNKTKFDYKYRILMPNLG
jgi:hypothetical protein